MGREIDRERGIEREIYIQIERGGGEREREGGMEKERERQTDRQTDRQREGRRQREWGWGGEEIDR